MKCQSLTYSQKKGKVEVLELTSLSYHVFSISHKNEKKLEVRLGSIKKLQSFSPLFKSVYEKKIGPARAVLLLKVLNSFR